MDRRERPNGCGRRCEHATFPVVVLPAAGSEKKGSPTAWGAAGSALLATVRQGRWRRCAKHRA